MRSNILNNLKAYFLLNKCETGNKILVCFYFLLPFFPALNIKVKPVLLKKKKKRKSKKTKLRF